MSKDTTARKETKRQTRWAEGLDGWELGCKSLRLQHRLASNKLSTFIPAAHLKWGREALRGLTYITTGRGPLRRWLWAIGRAECDKCECGIAQNAPIEIDPPALEMCCAILESSAAVNTRLMAFGCGVSSKMSQGIVGVSP